MNRMADIVVDADHFSKTFIEMLSPLQGTEIEDAITKVAVKVVRKYKPIIAADAKGKIKRVRNPNGPYADAFTTKKLGGGNKGTNCGASLWNKKYQLSHLIERPHEIWWTGTSTGNNYGFWKAVEPKMHDEFFEGVSDAVDDVIRRRIK